MAFPVLNFVYWPEVLRSGALPPDGDSIGMPMHGSVLLALLATPAIVGIAGLCLRRYAATTRLLTYRRDRPVSSALATVVLGGAGVALALGSFAELIHPLPWHERLWPIYAASWAPWMFGMRAAFVGQDAGAGRRRFGASGGAERPRRRSLMPVEAVIVVLGVRWNRRLVAAEAFAACAAVAWAAVFRGMAGRYAALPAFGLSGAWDVWIWFPLAATVVLVAAIAVFGLLARRADALAAIAGALTFALLPYGMMVGGGV